MYSNHKYEIWNLTFWSYGNRTPRIYKLTTDFTLTAGIKHVRISQTGHDTRHVIQWHPCNKFSFFVKRSDIHSNLNTNKQTCSFILTTTLQTLRWLRSLPEWSGRWHRICPPRWARIPLKVQLALKVHHKLYHLIYYCRHHWNRQGGSIGVAMYPIPGPWRRPPKPHFLVMSRSYFNLPPSAYTPVYLYPTSICTTTCEFIETCENVRDRFFLSRQNKLLFLSLILLLDLLERVSVTLNFLIKSRPNKQHSTMSWVSLSIAQKSKITIEQSTHVLPYSWGKDSKEKYSHLNYLI